MPKEQAAETFFIAAITLALLMLSTNQRQLGILPQNQEYTELGLRAKL